MKASEILETARSFLGCNEEDGSYRKILEIYNSHEPLAVGYPVQPDDDWCDAFLSAVAIRAGADQLIGTECGCERHVKLWQAMGIWLEDGRLTPEPGDIIVYNWDDRTQPNNGFSDHVGFVEAVREHRICTIEGNRTAGTGNPAVRRMTVPVGCGQIRGFARPRYEMEARPASQRELETVACQVIAGRWGAGEERRSRLRKAGWDCDAVQRTVNRLMKPRYDRVQFLQELQRALGVEADGIPGPVTLSAAPTLSRYRNPRHPAVKPVQKRLLALGYGETGAADGIAGPAFQQAVRHFQADRGCQTDGELTAGCRTWKCLLWEA